MRHLLRNRPMLALVCVAMAATCVMAQDKTDELRLRNGTTLTGRLVESDNDTVVFRADGKLKVFKRSEVQRIILAGERENEAKPDDTQPTDATNPWGTPPTVFKAKAPHKIKRVVSVRRITTNKNAEQGKFDPEVAIISGDGSKIAFWAPNSGLYTINPDGTERNLVWAKDDGDHRIRGDTFEMSPDGKVIYWQVPPFGAIRRVNSDGTDEKVLVNEGSEYTSLRLRQDGKRIFYGSRRGIFSIDTEGNGDFKEVITQERLGQIFDQGPIMLDQFDVSEDGSRVVLSVYHPKAKMKQLCAIKGNGIEFRQIVKTDFEPWSLTMSPDGERIVFWKPSETPYIVNWDGSDMHPLKIPPYDANASGNQFTNRFTADGKWFMYWGNEGGGNTQIANLESGDRFEPLNTGRWDNWGTLFPDRFIYTQRYTADMRRFVAIELDRPRQLVVGEINPRDVENLPILTDIEFGKSLSTNPQVPTHQSTLKARVKKPEGDFNFVQFMLSPMVQQIGEEPVRWRGNQGWYALTGDHQMRDDGKNGDAKAGDGLFSTNALSPHNSDFKPAAGHYPIRIVASAENSAVIVDVDGVDIK